LLAGFFFLWQGELYPPSPSSRGEKQSIAVGGKKQRECCLYGMLPWLKFEIFIKKFHVKISNSIIELGICQFLYTRFPVKMTDL
jgi:hypothetical protein